MNEFSDLRNEYILRCRSREGAASFYNTSEPLKTFCLWGVDMGACGFLGHRDTPQTEELKAKIRETVEYLILEERVDTFLFGSKSKFDELCYSIVTELKEKYKNIRRVAYLCKHETACLVGAGTSLMRQMKEIVGREVVAQEYEEVKKSDRVNSAGKGAYVERNQWLIDESEYIVSYCRKVDFKTGRSGTAIAVRYAQMKEKTIFNLFQI